VERAAPSDLLINCTSSGMDGALDAFEQLPIDPDQLGRYRCVVDLVYGERPTQLIEAGRAQGAATVDGLELLISQGALSFEQFTGHSSPVEVMRTAARGYRPPA
jgi:shikimate dehydrogenase